MVDFKQVFRERFSELDEYLDFLTNLEHEARDGAPRLGGESGRLITVNQRQVLYSSFYLQIYNTIEATIIKCMEGLSLAVNNEELHHSELKAELQEEWVRNKTRPNESLNSRKKFDKALKLYRELLTLTPINDFDIERGGGGSWDDEQIESLIKRLGWSLRVDRTLYSRIKRPYREDKSVMSYIAYLRNNLAHGSISFVECGDNVVVSDLLELKTTTFEYLVQVTDLFEKVIIDKSYKQESEVLSS